MIGYQFYFWFFPLLFGEGGFDFNVDVVRAVVYDNDDKNNLLRGLQKPSKCNKKNLQFHTKEYNNNKFMISQ